jgi:hypothetical protein
MKDNPNQPITGGRLWTGDFTPTVPASRRYRRSASSSFRALSDGEEGKVFGADWHVFLETCDFDAAWAAVPRPGIVVTEGEIRDDPILQPHLDEWRSGNDSAYHRFLQHVLDWTEDEDYPTE